MAKLKGSKTERNILTAFAGESQARNRYTYFASAARKEGFMQISAIFEETADQEKEHAKRLFKLLEGGELGIQTGFPAGVIGSTAENLKAAAAGEKHEWTKMYPGFADTAREEGLNDVAEIFEAIAVAEKQHEKRYLGLLSNVKAGQVFKKDAKAVWRASQILKKDAKVVWRCRNCGYVREGTEAPDECPACDHPQGYFEVLAENW